MAQSLVESWEIENIKLDINNVYSTVRRRLNMPLINRTPVSKWIENITKFLFDALKKENKNLNKEILLTWHQKLMQDNSIQYSLESGQYRTCEVDVIAGELGKTKTIFEALPSVRVEEEMAKFLNYVN